ncbi:GNAT family N-acetyltransferase [Natrialba asiatica]|uniref:GCN5-like N-acetyltransferase n=1 Tax=Natrialba asiatica (strain ATCC 700177 / DSM 12278 / JCM 9576 / FERM P-10747 / NBRC 102637 / 172P1) TaxID=29540 RepID=M0AHD8_NATA1|nr:GNAT family N-acetyltransferase [Natrialba asiatica]ELY97964.1 GCN5-like N-acetyltransferase [Natrialba asiatica DSM 12278]
MRVHVRTAGPDDELDIRRIIDAAMLDPGDVEARIDNEDVLVAGDRRGVTDEFAETPETSERERILGAIVLVPHTDERGAHISAVAVRNRHRNRGIGRELVTRALERERRLTARFDADVRPFYEALEFAIEPVDDRRYRGVVARSDAEIDG